MKLNRTWWRPLYIKDARFPNLQLDMGINCKTEDDLVKVMRDYRESSGCDHVILTDVKGTHWGYLYKDGSIIFLHNSPYSSIFRYYWYSYFGWYSPWRDI